MSKFSPVKILRHTVSTCFSTTFDDAVHRCIPLDVPRPKKNVYLTHNALRLKNKKCKLWNRYTTTKTPTAYYSYCQARNALRSLTRNLHCSYEKELVLNPKSSTKQFWKYVNSRMRSRPVINSLKKADGSTVYSDEGKSKMFNEFFTSVFGVDQFQF